MHQSCITQLQNISKLRDAPNVSKLHAKPDASKLHDKNVNILKLHVENATVSGLHDQTFSSVSKLQHKTTIYQDNMTQLQPHINCMLFAHHTCIRATLVWERRKTIMKMGKKKCVNDGGSDVKTIIPSGGSRTGGEGGGRGGAEQVSEMSR